MKSRISFIIVISMLWVIATGVFAYELYTTVPEEGIKTNKPKQTGAEFLRETNRTRPVIGVHYYWGVPAFSDSGETTLDNDLERIKAYFDPVVHVDMGTIAYAPPPDNPDSAKEITEHLQNVLDILKRAGMYQFFLANTSGGGIPEWFKKDAFAEGMPGNWLMLTISDPLYYQKAVRGYLDQVLGKFREHDVIASWYMESEPGGYAPFGALRNCDDQRVLKLFHQFLEAEEQGRKIEDFNRVAGREYKSFNDIGLTDSNWLVEIEVSRFASWLLYYYYQGNLVRLFQEKFPNIPAVTRWCEMGCYALDERDFSRHDSVSANYLGHTWYPGNPFVPYTNKNRAILGKLTSNFSLLRQYGRPISSAELAMWRGQGGPTQEYPTRPFRPYEFANIVYRSLYYNVGTFIVFSWKFPAEPNDFGFNDHAYYPDFLQAVRGTINELERIKPYATFGKSLPNEVGVLISRNANCYPLLSDINKNNHFYSDVYLSLANIMEDPRLSYFDIIEEHSGITYEKLCRYKGLVVYDVCLEPKTRDIIQQLAQKGHKMLIIGAPSYVDYLYRPSKFPSAYPVTGQEKTDETKTLSVTPVGGHPLIKGISSLELLGSTKLKLQEKASPLFINKSDSTPVAAVRDNIVYLCGIMPDLEQRKQLYLNFLKWCGVDTIDLYISRFENAVILQNFKSEFINTAVDGTILQEFPWTGEIAADLGTNRPQLWEVRGDFPWLAFEDTPKGRKIEGIFMDSGEVRVFRSGPGKMHPHLEGIPVSLGFTDFMLTNKHMRAIFRTREGGEYQFQFAPGMWDNSTISWQISQESGLEVVSKGEGYKISFSGKKEEVYRLDITRHKQ